MTLTAKQTALARLAAATARGDQAALAAALDDAFDHAALTVEESKSALEQLYAYCGFPRSLNALATLLATVEARQAAGKSTAPGRPAAAIPAVDMTVIGTEVQTALAGQPVGGPLFTFSPHIDRYLKAHLFGDIFADDRLQHQEREIVTIAALAAMDGVAGQLAAHLRIGAHTGLNPAQLAAVQAVARPMP